MSQNNSHQLEVHSPVQDGTPTMTQASSLKRVMMLLAIFIIGSGIVTFIGIRDMLAFSALEQRGVVIDALITRSERSSSGGAKGVVKNRYSYEFEVVREGADSSERYTGFAALPPDRAVLNEGQSLKVRYLPENPEMNASVHETPDWMLIWGPGTFMVMFVGIGILNVIAYRKARA